MAEYGEGTSYRIARRRITDMDDENRAVGEVDVEPTNNDDWSATIRYSVEGSNLSFTQVTIHATGADDVTSTIWKHFPIGDIRKYLRETFKENPEWMSAGAMRGVEEQKQRVEMAKEVLKKNKPQIGRKRKLNDEHWRAIADVYVYCARSDPDQTIYECMADEINQLPGYDETADSMKWQTERARVYGFLTRPGKGKTGGTYGPRYWESLKEEEGK